MPTGDAACTGRGYPVPGTLEGVTWRHPEEPMWANLASVHGALRAVPMPASDSATVSPSHDTYRVSETPSLRERGTGHTAPSIIVDKSLKGCLHLRPVPDGPSHHPEAQSLVVPSPTPTLLSQSRGHPLPSPPPSLPASWQEKGPTCDGAGIPVPSVAGSIFRSLAHIVLLGEARAAG